MESLKELQSDVDDAPVHCIGTTRFLAVVHCWFVSSKGFRVIELKAKDWNDAQEEADMIAFREGGDFRHAAVTVIELEKGEHQPRPRKAGERLTIWERITGRIWSA